MYHCFSQKEIKENNHTFLIDIYATKNLQEFIKKYHLPAASTIQSAVKSLFDKQLMTHNRGTCEVYDKFLSLWINKNIY